MRFVKKVKTQFFCKSNGSRFCSSWISYRKVFFLLLELLKTRFHICKHDVQNCVTFVQKLLNFFYWKLWLSVLLSFGMNIDIRRYGLKSCNWVDEKGNQVWILNNRHYCIWQERSIITIGSISWEGLLLMWNTPLRHKSGNLSCLFRFNTTLVRRVQPIYRRIAALGLHFFIL